MGQKEMRYFLIILAFLFLTSCGTYNLVTLERSYNRPSNVFVDTPFWGNYWFYNRSYVPYYIPPRVVVVNPKSRTRVKGRRSTTVNNNTNRGRNSKVVRQPQNNRPTPQRSVSRSSNSTRSSNNVRKQNQYL